jgi:hypothetical protein
MMPPSSVVFQQTMISDAILGKLIQSVEQRLGFGSNGTVRKTAPVTVVGGFTKDPDTPRVVALAQTYCQLFLSIK